MNEIPPHPCGLQLSAAPAAADREAPTLQLRLWEGKGTLNWWLGREEWVITGLNGSVIWCLNQLMMGILFSQKNIS